MVFVRYFLRRFIIAFFSISCMLAFLLNVIEFFEKIIRVSHTTLGTIAHFIILNFLPTFSHLMPLASWLATCLIIREFYAQKEWESLILLNINYNVLLKLFFLAGFTVTSSAFIFTEYLTIPLSCKAERIRSIQFKHEAPAIITKTWYKLSHLSYCYIGFLDQNSAQGKDLLIINLKHDGTLYQSTTAQCFTIQSATEHVCIHKGTCYNAEHGQSFNIIDKEISTPELFLRLSMHSDAPSLKNLSQKLFFHKKEVSTDTHTALARAFFEQFFFYIQIFFYPVITFILFSIFIKFESIKWIAALCIYPLFTTISALIFFLSQKYFSIWIFSIPLIVIFLILAGGFTLREQPKKA